LHRAARRLRHARRAVRGAHPGADRQDAPDADHPGARAVLARAARVDARAARGRGHDRSPRARSPAGVQPPAGSGGRDLRFLRKARFRAVAPGARGAAHPLVKWIEMRAQMRRSLATLLVLVAFAAAAQKPPPGLEPLPEPPPPPPMPEGSIDEPRVVIPIQKEDKVEP